jgi:hypothetical protein
MKDLAETPAAERASRPTADSLCAQGAMKELGVGRVLKRVDHVAEELTEVVYTPGVSQ